MCFPTCSALGSFFILASFVLNLLIVIGQLSNSWFLTKLYFLSTWNTSENLSYTYGLWNYCTGDASLNIKSCATPVPAYNWAKTPEINKLLPSLVTSTTTNVMFLVFFIFLFTSLGLSFIFWLMSLPICCTRHKRAWGYSMSTLCLINFLITLAGVIMSLILIISGTRKITHASSEWQGEAGNSLWLMICTCVSMLLATICYSGGASCGGKRKQTGQIDPYKEAYPNYPPQPQTIYVQQPYVVPANQNLNNPPNVAVSIQDPNASNKASASAAQNVAP